MNQYVTGAVIKELREKNKMTQLQLAEKLGVSDKTVSKWETAKGYPDITLLEPIAKAFRISEFNLIISVRDIMQKLCTLRKVCGVLTKSLR